MNTAISPLTVINAEIIRETPRHTPFAPPQYKFIHLRYHFTHGEYNVIDQSNPHGIWNRGGLTIAIQQIPGRLVYTFALCATTDNFCRKTGRRIAVGRLEAGQFSELPFKEGDNFGRLVNEYIKPLAYRQASEAGRWATTFEREIAKKWVSVDIADHLF
jgi:hypothetical protein